MSTGHLFDLSQVVIAFSPYTLTGKGEVSIEALAPEDSHETSGDGEAATVITSKDNRHVVTISVAHGSNAHRDLQAIAAEQKAEEAGALAERAFRLYDPSNGDTWSERYGRLITPRVGRKMTATSPGMIEYKILLPNPTVDLGSTL
jgi:hypothetical protein